MTTSDLYVPFGDNPARTIDPEPTGWDVAVYSLNELEDRRPDLRDLGFPGRLLTRAESALFGKKSIGTPSGVYFYESGWVCFRMAEENRWVRYNDRLDLVESHGRHPFETPPWQS